MTFRKEILKMATPGKFIKTHENVPADLPLENIPKEIPVETPQREEVPAGK